MIIKSTAFIKSSSSCSECPTNDIPEFAFIGRSNVGKSSLINMLTLTKKLAKISGGCKFKNTGEPVPGETEPGRLTGF